LQGEWEKVAILSLIYESMVLREKHMESKTNVQICGAIVVGIMDGERVYKVNSSEYNTFRFLCKRLGPYLKKEETRFRVTTPVQERGAMSLHRLDSGDGLQSIGDLYRVYKSTLSNTMREFYKVVSKHLQHVFVQTPHES
jgi:hypothetical protein